ncbi:CoA pyrophosphatase [Celeribacter sp.]|uniref:CoA pyrophosphatase n=1 Tax=Celeribacter sp. TaxID=1890673 RepID=UPI003A947C1C
MAPRIERALIEHAVAAGGTPSSDYDLNADLRSQSRGELRDAGVLVAFIDRPSGAHIILTKRASHLKHHPGQVAFPGGRMDPCDRDVVDAALREANEEIGLPPASVDVIGQLPHHETVSSYAMTPVLGWVTRDFAPQPEAGEVAEYFEVPADFVLNPSNFRIEKRRWRGADRAYFTVPFGPYYIWGATARVLRGLAERVAQ